VASIDNKIWQSTLEEIKCLLDVCKKLEIIHTINVPSAPPHECVLSYYETYPGATQPVLGLPPGRCWQDFWKAYVQHIDEIAALVESAGMRLAIEAVPHGIVSNSDSMLRLTESLPDRNLGMILDTGHVHYLRESFTMLCDKLSGHIWGTHLNDNDGSVDDHDPPGEGTIDWSALFKALWNADYTGPLDIEINLSNDPDKTYLEAKKFLEQQLDVSGADERDER
jgi:sugar phosphate isomerase/epimerase